ncbi:MAG: disulfide bond formation protein B [Candidatus Moraniibacteriota bacterium]
MKEAAGKLLVFLHNPRGLLLIIALYCASLLLFAFILVRLTDLVPCPLCIVQRFFYAFVGLSAIMGYVGWWSWLSTRLAGAAVTVFSAIGWAVAARHVYLQHFQEVDHASGCAVSFGSFLDDFIFALGGTGNCAIIDWTFLGLSIADWSFIAFMGLTAAGSWIYLKSRPTDVSMKNTGVAV